MRVYYGIDVGPGAVNKEMHAQFARGIAVAATFVAIEIHDHHVLGMHHPFAHGGGRGQDAAVVEPDGKIAVGRRHVAGIV